MKISKIAMGLSKVFGMTGLKVKAASPEIMIGMSIITGAGCVFMACKATLKVNDVLDEHESDIARIKEVKVKVDEGLIATEKYTEDDYKKDLVIRYTQTGVKFLKLYWPAATLGLLSVGFALGGHKIMKGRNVALMAAYKTLEEGFTKYRQYVIADQGEEKDYQYKNGLVKEKYTEEITDDKGKVKKVEKERLVRDPNGYSMYARFFDEQNPNWDKDPEYNKMFLLHTQNHMNDLLRVRKYVFLNDVYEALGFERTQAGASVGWILNGDGDGFIDFGIFDEGRMKVRQFVNGDERSIILDFNVDGPVYECLRRV